MSKSSPSFSFCFLFKLIGTLLPACPPQKKKIPILEAQPRICSQENSGSGDTRWHYAIFDPSNDECRHGKFVFLSRAKTKNAGSPWAILMFMNKHHPWLAGTARERGNFTEMQGVTAQAVASLGASTARRFIARIGLRNLVLIMHSGPLSLAHLACCDAYITISDAATIEALDFHLHTA
jgi:hypothetical protein